VSARRAWLAVVCPTCGATPSLRCGTWHWPRGAKAKWVPGSRLHVSRGWQERPCPKCRAEPGYPCETPSGRVAAHVHTTRKRAARGELVTREAIWAELHSRGTTIATVPFSGRAGSGGSTDRIALLGPGHDGLAEIELWSRGFRDELCHALEAPVWARFASFVGQPLVTGHITWLADRRVIELDAQRAGRRLEERLR
jgi:hypothetical protein